MINVDRVYQTVQKILNKEQRGYLPPVEFNLFAEMAQTEIFENYFYDLDVYMQGGGNDSDYADIIDNIEQKIEAFSRQESYDHGTLAQGTATDPIINYPAGFFPYPDDFYRLGRISLDKDVSRAADIPEVPAVPGVMERYDLTLNSLAYNVVAMLSPTTFNISVNPGNITSGGTAVNGLVGPLISTLSDRTMITTANSATLVSVVNTGTMDPATPANTLFTVTISAAVNPPFAAGTVVRNFTFTPAVPPVPRVPRMRGARTETARDRATISDKVSHKDITYIQASPLTAPTSTQPVHIYKRYINDSLPAPYSDFTYTTDVSSEGVVVYPTTTTSIVLDYIKTPDTPNWAYMNMNSRAIYSAANSVHFELHPSELPDLVVKICALAGVAVRALDVTQLMQSEEAQMINEKKQ